MKLHLYQIAVTLIAAFMIFQGFSNFLKGKKGQTFLKLLIRLIVWGGMASVAIYPNFATNLANIIGMQGNVNAVILTGFILVFLMIFKLLSAIERLEQQITEIIRSKALNKIKNE